MMAPVPCHLEESMLMCPIESIVNLPSNGYRIVLKGVLSCPVPDDITGCSCEGTFPSSIFISARDESDNAKDGTSTCRCFACEAFDDSIYFGRECDHPVVGNCWGFDCQGRCQLRPIFSMDLIRTGKLEDTTGRSNVPTNDHIHVLPPNASPLGSSLSPAILSPDFSSSTKPHTAALVAQSASLLWILSFMAVTQNSTDIWSSTPDTASIFI